MAKRLNYEIGFTTDTNQLKKDIQSVNAQLNKIAANKINLSFDDELREGARAAQELQQYLNRAFNVDTGKLDLTALTNSLKKSKTSLEDYAQKLSSLGPEGRQAFLSVANVITKAETPTLRLNKLFDNLWTTMKNTARWQLTSSALHSFMGGLQTCYGYAQDLNSSLNNIRIVTKNSTEQMAEFAKQANNAAKALSSTTTDYTDAALIYYQQGLDDRAVKDRTDTTIKMANVTATSAKEVSDQMTAIWNNFDNGTKSLEYYADVITALGAATASSSAEISTGLEKFSAIAKSVGLSYEYATSALATVTATTRQSAEIVGTAFKTLFARIQGLSLGETLDDGTDLNKYSEALMKVGINIKDQNNELKDMDIILDEMAAKWDTLNKDQQLALAQTVAGVRQYTQLVALMDNWDFMEENLTTATGSTGALQEQADIYAESWEAARDRVRAAAEDIYDSIINEDFFIGLDDALTPILTGIANVIDAFGGMGGTLVVLGNIFTRVFHEQAAQGLRDTKDFIASFVGFATGKQKELNNQTRESAQRGVANMGTENEAEARQLDFAKQRIELANKLEENRAHMNIQDQKKAELELAILDTMEKQYETTLKENDAIRDQLNATEKKYTRGTKRRGQVEKSEEEGPSWAEEVNPAEIAGEDEREVRANLALFAQVTALEKGSIISDVQARREAETFLNKEKTKYLKTTRDINTTLGATIKIQDSLVELSEEDNESTEEKAKKAERYKAILKTIQDLQLSETKVNLIKQDAEDYDRAQKDLKKLQKIEAGKISFDTEEEKQKEINVLLDNIINKIAKINMTDYLPDYLSHFSEELRDSSDAAYDLGENMVDAAIKAQILEEQTKGTGNVITPSIEDWADKILNTANAITSVITGIQAIQNLGSIWSDEDLSTGEKIVQTLTSIGMIMPTLTALYTGLTGVIITNTQAKINNGAIDVANLSGLQKLIFKILGVTVATTANTTAEGANTAAVTANTVAWYANPMFWGAAILIGAIVGITAALNAQAKAIEESTQAAIDNAKASKETIDTNGDLIKSTKELLDVYTETGEGKDELDEKTRGLVEAYDLEGAALAKLSGKYEDYNDVIRQAVVKQKEELKDALESQENAINASQYKLLETARKGIGHLDFVQNYEGEFSGWSAFSDIEARAAKYYEENVSEKFNPTITPPSAGIGRTAVGFSFDANDTQNIVDFYDEISEAITKMEASMSPTDLGSSGIYTGLVEWQTKMKDVVEEYKELVDNVNKIRIQLGAEGSIISEDQINNFSAFKTWAEQVNTQLSEMGYEGKEAEDIFNDLVKTSINPAVQEFKTLYDAIADVSNQVTKDSGLTKEKLEEIFTNSEYDTAVLAAVSWGSVTEKTWEDAYNSAKKYQDAVDDVAQATSLLEGIEAAKEVIQKAKGELDIDTLQNVGSSIDWGNEEAGIIEFSTFLEMNAREQSEYLQQLTTKSYEQMTEGLNNSIEASQEKIKQQQEFINNADKELINDAEEIVNAWNKVQEAYNEWQDLEDTGQEDQFNFDKYEDAFKIAEIVDWDAFKTQTEEEVAAAIEEATKDKKVTLNAYANAKNLIKDAQDQIDRDEKSLQIIAKVNFDNQLSNIENSVDGIVSIFDAISKGVESTTNEAGQKVWGFSREAAEAIESVYPGFLANAQLLRDGTFALSEEMYKAFFDSANGQLSADTQSKAGMLQNIITMLEEKKESAKSSLAVAQQLASGEMTLDEAKNKYGEQLMTDFVNGKENANGEMLSDEVDMLTQSDANWDTLWTDVSDYSAQGAKNMATNVAESTGLVLQNLENIRDAAYAACLQVSDIGKPNVTKREINTSVSVVDSGNWVNDIDTSNGVKEFFDTLKNTTQVTTEDLFIYGSANEAQARQVGKELEAYYENLIDSYDAQIGSAKIAQSKLLEGIDNSYDKLAKARQSGGKNKGESKKKDLTNLQDIIDRYHEIDDQLDDVTDEIKRLENATDKLYGQEKLDNMDKVIEKLKEEKKLIGDKIQQAKNYLNIDKQTLENATNALGLNIELIFDEKGNITNIENAQKLIYQHLNNLETKYNNLTSAETQEAFEKSTLEPFRKIVENFKDSVALYEETRELLESLGDEDLNIQDQIWDAEEQKEKEKAEKIELTLLDDILERYHNINDVIDDVTRATEKLAKVSDRLYGTKKFANMDKEIAKLKEQNNLIKGKAEQAQKYLKIDEDNLRKVTKDLGLTNATLGFDGWGNVAAEGIQRAMVQRINELEEIQNKLKTKSEQDKFYEEEIEPYKEKMEKFTEALEIYEETKELLQDLDEESLEILRQIEDLRFEKIVSSIEIRLDYKDAKKDINDLAKTIRKAVGTAYDWGKDVADIDFQNMEIEKSKMAEYQDEYSQLLALAEEAKTNPAIDQEAIAEQLEELRGQIIGSAESLVEWAESLENILPDAIDAAREHFDQFINQLEHNTTVIDTIKEIMVLQGLTLKTAEGFNDIQDIHQKRMDATLGQAKLNRAWYERAAEQLKEAQAALEATPRDTQQYDILKANRDALLQEYNEAQEAMLESAKETMDEARDMYVDAVERTAYELEQTLTKGQGFDLLQDKYDHYLDTEERYLDTVNRIYETTSLNNKLQKELDKTTNAAGAAKLRALQEEFKLRQANNKLSKYDIDVMNAKLDLTLKQMALEEAQNAKTDLRLVRNAQGNWNYQYTANQDNVNAADQEYLDAMNEYYNLAKNRVKEVTGEIIDTWQEMTEKIKEVYEDETLTVEEREARIAEIREYYSQKVKDLEEEKQKAIVDMTEAGQIAIDDFKDRHHDVLDEMGGDVDKLKDIFGDDLAAILSGADEFNNQFAIDMDALSEEVTDFDKLFEDIINNMNEAVQDYQDIVVNVNSEVGISYEELKEMLDEVSESTEEVIERGFDETDMMWNKLDALREVTEQYAEMADAILEAAEAMRQLAAETVETQYNTIGGVDNIDYSALIAQGIVSGATSSQIEALKEDRTNSSRWTDYEDSENWHSNDWIVDAANAYKNGTATEEQKKWMESALNYSGPFDNADVYNQKDPESILDYIKQRYGLATGGYTGLFDDAKLAFLHEKELVLNAQDTANILAAVNTVRNLDSIWQGANKNLDSIIAQSLGMMMSRLSSTAIPDKDSQILEQKITIEHIEFPNANDKNEILEALHSLPDMASQWARIKKD